MPNRAQRRAAARQTNKPNGTASKAAQPPLLVPVNERPPISEAQLAANRANAQHSTGAKTESGRATSSQNRTTHGLARHNGTFALLLSEDPNGFEFLKASLVSEHQPTTETESILIDTMAESHWLANRAQNLQASCFDPITGQITDAKMFSLYLRYQTTHTRAFHKALSDLLKLRSERRKVQNGFEAQQRREAALRMKILEYQTKKEVDAEKNALQNPELRADMTALGMASLKKGPEYEALKAAFHAKWGSAMGFAKEESQAAAA